MPAFRLTIDSYTKSQR